ncbi:uncharacterized protein LOC124140049 [Haliotis rufescens]|uniref:uncharacterized protein LOC124140049 n=1 Tax=Haliotis rufescens TaxID=6454 RepID=UPI00201EC2D0|nr:uncharacterized protein LOC124140049 [Haliotis rufescens]
MGMRIVTSIRIVIALILPCSYFTQENICPTTSGEKVVHVCEGNFATGTSVYLDTFKAVNYEGGCTCQLRAQGGAVDLQVSVQGVHAACDATLYFAPPIDHTYNCADKTPTTTTGRIESGQSVFLSLTKSSDVADFCVHLVQTSTAGSLNVACTKGTLKPASTTTIAPAPAVTTSPTTIIENICPTTSGEKVVHVCEGNFATGTSVYLDTFKAVNYEGGCTCQLRAQGGAVDLQVSVQGVHAACDATLYFAPPIDHTYNCADKTPATTTGRIESGQSVFLSLTKSSDVADFCVHLVQTSTAGSLNVACTKGTLKPASTTTIAPAPAPAVTTSPTTIIELLRFERIRLLSLINTTKHVQLYIQYPSYHIQCLNVFIHAYNRRVKEVLIRSDERRHCIIWYFVLIAENICPTSSGEKVVHVCEGNFATGTSVYLDTFKAVNYEGGCTCQLRAQGGAVDLQVSVQGVHAACDATLYFAPPIDHTYNCADKTPATTTGRIESGQSVFLSLTKSSDVADFCVHLVQTSSAGSLNVACSSGTLKSTSPPATTSSPTNAPNNVATTLTTSVTQSKGSSSESPDNTVTESKGSSSEKPDNTVTESKGSSSEIPDNTVTESKGSSSESPDNTVTESKGSSSENPDNTVTESKGLSSESPDNTVTESKGSSSEIPDKTVTESNGSSSESPDNTVTESKGSSSESPDNTVTESKGSSSESPDNTVTESKGSSSENTDNTVTESKGSSSESPDNTVTESKGSSTESPNITPSGNTGLNTAETPQSVIVVSFVVVGVFAAIVVVMILFGVFTYCRDKSRLGKLRAAQNLPNGHTNV